MNVLVQIQAARRGEDRRALHALVRRVVETTVRCADGPLDSETSVLLVDDGDIRLLNSHYRGQDRPTDVLGFAASEAEGFVAPVAMLGDVVVSVETALRQASERGHSLRRELAILLIHGTAHLLGYDHESVTAAESKRMRALELAALEELERQLVV